MRAWLLGLALLAAGPVLAQDLPVAPPSPMIDPSAATEGRAIFAQGFALGAFKGGSGTSLADARKAMGGVVDGLDSVEWLCYDLAGSGQRVWLSSDEMSSGFVDTVTVTPRGATRSSHCPELPPKYQPLVIDSNIRLGMTETDLARRLGAPSKKVGTWVVYKTEQVLRDGSATLTLVVNFINGRAVFITAGHIVND